MTWPRIILFTFMLPLLVVAWIVGVIIAAFTDLINRGCE